MAGIMWCDVKVCCGCWCSQSEKRLSRSFFSVDIAEQQLQHISVLEMVGGGGGGNVSLGVATLGFGPQRSVLPAPVPSSAPRPPSTPLLSIRCNSLTPMGREKKNRSGQHTLFSHWKNLKVGFQ